ncbi:STAS domain-containing protein [Streptomyces sp. NPDC048349]|uniref:STAS domain-containing protein n=1 Tax=Streptomyces sp. NPDC048349 TaxID=3155486 RepID=UPI003437E883
MVTATTHEGVTVITVRGHLDDESAPRLTEALVEAAGNGSARTVVDLSGTGFADSSILHALFDGQKIHSAAGTAFVIAGPLGTAVSRLFDITGANRALRVADSLEIAMTC